VLGLIISDMSVPRRFPRPTKGRTVAARLGRPGSPREGLRRRGARDQILAWALRLGSSEEQRRRAGCASAILADVCGGRWSARSILIGGYGRGGQSSSSSSGANACARRCGRCAIPKTIPAGMGAGARACRRRPTARFARTGPATRSGVSRRGGAAGQGDRAKGSTAPSAGPRAGAPPPPCSSGEGVKADRADG
jgi:hypothetical protein